MDKDTIYIIMGVSGSGKTTIGQLLATELGVPFYDGDNYHSKANVEKMSKGIPLTDTDRMGWLQSLNSLALENRIKGAVIVCSALKTDYRDVLKKDMERQMRFVYLQGSYNLIMERLHKRKGHFMPPGLLESQFETLEPPKHAITVSIDATPKEIVAEIMNRLDLY